MTFHIILLVFAAGIGVGVLMAVLFCKGLMFWPTNSTSPETMAIICSNDSAPMHPGGSPIPKSTVMLNPTCPGVAPLEFEPIGYEQLPPKLKASVSQEYLNALNALPAVAVNAASMIGAQGLFRATVDPNTLIKYANGAISSMQRGLQQGIGAHAGFMPVNPASIFIPILVFQALALITGQYYLHGISKQLQKLERRIEHLVMLFHNEKVARLHSDFNFLRSIASKKTCFEEDLVTLQSIRREASAFADEYSKILSRLSINDIEVSGMSFFASSKVRGLKGMIVENNPRFCAEMLLMATQLGFNSLVLEFRGNAMLCEKEPRRIRRIPELEAEISQYAKNPVSNDMEKACRYINAFATRAMKIEESAFLENGIIAARELKVECQREAKELRDDFERTPLEQRKIAEELSQKLAESREVYLLSDGQGMLQTLTE